MAVKAAQVAVGTSATLLVAADTDRVSAGQRVTTYAPTGQFYVGGPGVTTATGFLVPAGGSYSERLDPADTLYGIVASGTVTVHVIRAGA